MNPVVRMYLFWNIFGIKISVYIICACIGLIISISVICSKLLKKGLVHKYVFVILQALVGVFIGSKSFGILCTILSSIFIYHNSLTWGDIAHSGIVYYGGLLGYLLFVLLICKIKKLDFDMLSNILAVGIPIFHCFGRIGCFFAGCCYGTVGTSVFTVPYRVCGSTVWENRVPVQLIEAGFELILFMILNYIYNTEEHYRLNTRKPFLLRLYLLSYSFFRLVIENLRGDAIRGIFHGLSYSQIIAILIICSIYIKFIRERNMR